jgi:hypothetical protein
LSEKLFAALTKKRNWMNFMEEMKIGDLVRHRRNHSSIGIIASLLKGNGYFDVLRSDGVIVFTHERSVEVISEHRCG